MNTTNENLELEINIKLPNGTKEDVDDVTRQLLDELRDFHLESLNLKRGDDILSDVKSVDPITIGTIALVVLPSLLPKVVEFVQAWSMRGDKKIIKFRGKIAGQIIEFEGSSDDLQKIISRLEKHKK
jgi:hypothetical protein